MEKTTNKSAKSLKLSLAAISLASAITAFGPGIQQASAGFATYSGPTCPQLGCSGGSLTCATFSYGGIPYTCYTHS